MKRPQPAVRLPSIPMKVAFPTFYILLLLVVIDQTRLARADEIEVPTRPFFDPDFNSLACLDVERGVALSAGSDLELRSGSSRQGLLLVWDLATDELVKKVPMPAAIFRLELDRLHHRVAIAGGPGNRDDTSPFLIIYDYATNEVVFEEHDTSFHGNGKGDSFGWIDEPEGLISICRRYANDREVLDARMLVFPPDGGKPRWHDISDRVEEFKARLAIKEQQRSGEEGILAFNPIDVDRGFALGMADEPRGLLIDEQSNRVVCPIGPDRSQVGSHAIARDGSALAVEVGHRSLVVWDFKTMTQHTVDHLPPGGNENFLRFAFSGNGRHLYVADCIPRKKIADCDKLERLFVWNLSGKEMEEITPLPPHEAISVSTLKSGQLLVSRGGRLTRFDIETKSEKEVGSTWRDLEMAHLFVSPGGRYLWRSYALPETQEESDGVNDLQGLELVSTDRGKVMLRLPARGSVPSAQTACFDHLQESETFVMGSEVKTATGGFVHNELHLFTPKDTKAGQVQLPLTDPDGPMLTWCGFLKSQGRWLIGASRSNGTLESFDPETGRAVAEPIRDPLIEDWEGAFNKPCAIPDSGRVVLRRTDGGLRFMELNPDGSWRPYADLVIGGKDQWLLRLSNGYYWATLSGPSMVRLREGDSLAPLSHLDLSYNRPQEVAKVFGAPDEVVSQLEFQWKTRLARHGIVNPPSASAAELPRISPQSPPFAGTETSWIPELKWNAPTRAVASIHFLINGVPLHGLDGLRVDPGMSDWKGEIQLASGLNQLEAFVRDTEGNDSLHWKRRVWVRSAPRKPDLYFFGIGICDYQSEDLQDLEYPVKDVGDLAERLSQSQGRFGKVVNIMVKDGEATREGILKAAQSLSMSQPDDHVIIFLAGHGMLDDKNQYYFGTHDLDPLRPQENGLSYAELQGLFAAAPALQRIMLLDTCHAGEFGGDGKIPTLALNSLPRGVVVHPLNSRSSGPVQPKVDGPGIDVVEQLFTDLRVDTGAQVICAAQSAEVAYEGGDAVHNGWFTHCLVKHLSINDGDTNEDGRTSVREVAEAVSNGVRLLSEGTQNPAIRESNDAARFSFWPADAEGLPPEQFLESYLWFASTASGALHPEKASMLFAETARYFGRDVNRSSIEQDIAKDGEKFWTIQYSPNHLRIEPGVNGCRILNYELELFCAGGARREGTVPCRMILSPNGSSWLITSLEATGKGVFR